MTNAPTPAGMVELMTLRECPPGLFLFGDILGFKSEYGAMEPVGLSPHHQQWKVGNRPDAYCADSGEYFWGGETDRAKRDALMVEPISSAALAPVAAEGGEWKRDMRDALDLALTRLAAFEPADSRAVSNEYVAMAAAGTEFHNDAGREIIRAALRTEPTGGGEGA